MTTRWLDEDQRAAWLRLNAVAELLPAALDAQLRRDAALTHFAAGPRGAPTRGARARRAPRLPGDGRATTAHLTEPGWDAVVAAAPGHVETVRRPAVDPLTREQIGQLRDIGEALLEVLDPEGHLVHPVVHRTGPPAGPDAPD